MSLVLGVPTAEVNHPLQDSGYICVRCGYNLTGPTSTLCPECAWQIDWRLAGLDEEHRREGTAAHRARGWRKIDQTALTVLTMLFTPWRFARQVRGDERLGPSLIVAGLSFLTFFTVEAIKAWSWFTKEWPRPIIHVVPYLLGLLAVVLCQSLTFASLYRSSAPRSPRWVTRFRRWLVVSFYTTCFVAMWPAAGCPPVLLTPVVANYFWPPAWILKGTPLGMQLGRGASADGWSLALSIIFYWWWAVLATVLVVRHRPRWVVPLLMVLVPAIACMGTWVGVLTSPLCAPDLENWWP